MSKKETEGAVEYIEINYDDVYVMPKIPPLKCDNGKGYKYVFVSDKPEFLKAVQETRTLEPRVVETVRKKSGEKTKLFFGVTNEYLDASVALGDFCWCYDIEPVFLNGHKVLTGEDYLEANGII